MILGILGMIDASRPLEMQRASPCGNGKTNFLTFLLYEEFRQKDRLVITNFHTRFRGGSLAGPSWSRYMTSQEIFDHWWDPDLEGAVIGITELESLLNSAGRTARVITYIEKCLNQRRKSGYDIFWDSQRWGSGDLRIRDKTDYIYRPEKWHTIYSADAACWVPVERCPLDICELKHQILIYQEIPRPTTIKEMLEPKFILNSWEIGELYDTKEKMIDTIQYNPDWEHIHV
jgi:hypothetical protein